MLKPTKEMDYFSYYKPIEKCDKQDHTLKERHYRLTGFTIFFRFYIKNFSMVVNSGASLS
ncbi:MAG: hypothetical protein RBG13Loki_2636 [Promethearchaeota archaeon CR_4]|nr:MAG: hypothetical protein RBG13Loki_2636 [Candidatus Lokiarchaeota archaeon CR_4]